MFVFRIVNVVVRAAHKKMYQPNNSLHPSRVQERVFSKYLRHANIVAVETDPGINVGIKSERVAEKREI